jgi:hypothetical protein
MANANRDEMSKTERALYIAVMEALKAHNCIAGYTSTIKDVIPEWQAGGAERAFQEVTTNDKPFGLKRQQRGVLLMVLPKKERDRFDAELKKQFGF